MLGTSMRLAESCEFIKVSHEVCCECECDTCVDIETCFNLNGFELMMQRINDGFEFKMRSIMMGTSMRLAESCEFENSMQRIVMGSSTHT